MTPCDRLTAFARSRALSGAVYMGRERPSLDDVDPDALAMLQQGFQVDRKGWFRPVFALHVGAEPVCVLSHTERGAAHAIAELEIG